MSSWIPEWAQKRYEAWTNPMEWMDTAASWTSKEEWKQWYAGSTLESAANIAKATPGVGAHFVATLLEPPVLMTFDLVSGVISRAEKANRAFQGFAKEACIQYASVQKEEKDSSWLVSWIKSVGRGFSQFLATIWQFLKSPFIIN